MSEIEFIDRTGQPPEIVDLEGALKLVEKRMVTISDIKDPELFMEFPTIRRALKLLIELTKKAKA